MAITISTIIPAYNCEETLGRALDSILDQTHPPDEIIVVNDGSTDSTAHVIESYAKKHPTIHSITQENSGPAAARNHGVKLAKSDWVSFLDSDDYWYPHHLKNLTDVLQTHPELSWAAADYDTDRGNVRRRKVRKTSSHSVLLSYLAIAYQREKNPVNSNSTLVRRSVFEECGGFREDWYKGEDLWLWFQIGLRYPQLGYSPIASSFYTYRPTSLTNKDFSYQKELNLTVHKTDQMIQEVKAKNLLERKDVQIYLAGRVNTILYLSLFLSNREYRKWRNKYRSFLSYTAPSLRIRIYTGLSFCGISVSRFHALAACLCRCLYGITKGSVVKQA